MTEVELAALAVLAFAAGVVFGVQWEHRRPFGTKQVSDAYHELATSLSAKPCPCTRRPLRLLR